MYKTDEVFNLLKLAIELLPIVLFFKVWGMTKDIRLLKNNILFAKDNYQEVKIAFLKGDSVKAQDLLDTAFFNEIINLATLMKKPSTYDKNYPLLVKRFKKLYFSMSLTPPDFEVYKDVKNIP